MPPVRDVDEVEDPGISQHLDGNLTVEKENV